PPPFLPPLPPSRSALPASNFRPAILQSLASSQVLVLAGETGCGKSTQIPQYLLNVPGSNICVSQPRRVAAITLAERVATDHANPAPPGSANSLVGYKVRLDKKTSTTTRITYMTIGILLRMLINGPANLPYTHIVLDEVHERGLELDFTLGLVKKLLATDRNIRVIIMSATVNMEKFLTYFSSIPHCPPPESLQIPGRTFPVTLHSLPDCELAAGKTMEPIKVSPAEQNPKMSPRVVHRIDEQFIVGLATSLVKRKDGAILVFLPGQRDIDSLHRRMRDDRFLGKNATVLPLHSSLPRNKQRLVFLPPEQGVKIVLSTNVAETSVTIPDVVHVIDTGIVKESRYKSGSSMKELVTVWITRHSMQQRCGRAGRVQAGHCWRMFSPETAPFTRFTLPEIFRVPLEDLILQVFLLEELTNNGAIAILDWLATLLEPPPKSAVVHSCVQLQEVGAIKNTDKGVFRLTPLGFHLAHLPLDVRVAKILVHGCLLSCLEPSLKVAAILSATKTILYSGRGAKTSSEQIENIINNGYGGRKTDHHARCDLAASISFFDVYKNHFQPGVRGSRWKWAKENGMDYDAISEVEGLITQFTDLLIDANFVTRQNLPSHNINSSKSIFLQCCLVSGLYPNVAVLQRPKVTGKGGNLITKDKERARPHFSSFQMKRVKDAGATGKDAYVVFHSKHRTVGVGGEGMLFLSQVSFVSRFALLLFCGGAGDCEVDSGYITLGNFLKLKVGGSGDNIALLVQGMRNVIDNMLTDSLVGNKWEDEKFLRICGTLEKLLVDE
ncbi:hypothetical protein TrLO_g5825, partial [Triparma laevis f. longispina]